MKLLIFWSVFTLQVLFPPMSLAWSPLTAIESEIFPAGLCHQGVAASEVISEDQQNQEEQKGAEEEEPDCD